MERSPWTKLQNLALRWTAQVSLFPRNCYSMPSGAATLVDGLHEVCHDAIEELR
jgi:hypothetical protein